MRGTSGHGGKTNIAARPMALLALWLCMASGPAVADDATERASVVLNGVRFEVEIAADDESRRQGLSGRDTLPPGQGMLFVYATAQPVSFWMQGMRFPLDILYFDAGGRLRTVHAAVPPRNARACVHYRSEGDVGYVLELGAGVAARIGARPGDRLRVSLP